MRCSLGFTEVATPKGGQIIRNRDIYRLQSLIEAGINVNVTNVNNTTPLIIAAITGNIAVVDMLIRAGANINAADNNGDTALTVALLKIILQLPICCALLGHTSQPCQRVIPHYGPDLNDRGRNDMRGIGGIRVIVTAKHGIVVVVGIIVGRSTRRL